ncbi:acylphosphatase [Akkermansia muciniphila]|uniref:acylphosphatase n=1 Tax=Akkermansia muciniphila TaxID=239935 RepID=UPI003CE5BEB0
MVQGVGFRPHVYRLAVRHGLKGFVRNTESGVEIHVEGEPGAPERFLDRSDGRPAGACPGLWSGRTVCEPAGLRNSALRKAIPLPEAFR